MMERRRARQIALQLLYQMEVRGMGVDEVLTTRQQIHRQPLSDFAFRLVKGVERRREEIDRLIIDYSEHWEIDRMPIVDRNIVRICLYEMLEEEEIPFSVSINEAVELAKTYGGEDSGKFVNGLVARIAQQLRTLRKERERR